MSRPGTHRRERTVADAETDAEAARLRASGCSYAEIAKRQGCSVSTAHQRVARAIAAVPVEAVEELRQVELARLDTLIAKAFEVLNASHPLVSNGRRFDDLEDAAPILGALRELRALSESRRKLLGLDAPARQTVTVITEDVVDAAIRQLEAELDERAAG